MAKKQPGPLPWSYDEMSAKIKHRYTAATYFNYLTNINICMFEYDNLPESIDPRFLEIYLTLWGAVGIKKDGDEYLLGQWADRGGQLDRYGLGEELISSAGDGTDVTGIIGEDCCIVYNNLFMSADTDILADAETMTNIDQSAGINVLFSRIAPVLGVPDSKNKDAVKQMIKNILDGNLETVVSDNIITGLGLGDINSGGLSSIDITQPERIQYVQYLSQYFDFVFRRHFARRGLPVRSSTKAAQQSADEVHGLDAVAWGYPMSKLKARIEGFDAFNKLYGENVVPHFSEIWQREYDKYMSDAGDADSQTEGGDQDERTTGESLDTSADDTGAMVSE